MRFIPKGFKDGWVKNADNSATRDRTGWTTDFPPDTPCTRITETRQQTFTKIWDMLFTQET
jgi:hypothetical protein